MKLSTKIKNYANGITKIGHIPKIIEVLQERLEDIEHRLFWNLSDKIDNAMKMDNEMKALEYRIAKLEKLAKTNKTNETNKTSTKK